MIELVVRLPCWRCGGRLYYHEQRSGLCVSCATEVGVSRICDVGGCARRNADLRSCDMPKPATTPSSEAPTQEQPGPYSSVTSTKYEISGLTLTVTNTHDANGLPPYQPCGCANMDERDVNDDRWAALAQIASEIAHKLGLAVPTRWTSGTDPDAPRPTDAP